MAENETFLEAEDDVVGDADAEKRAEKRAPEPQPPGDCGAREQAEDDAVGDAGTEKGAREPQPPGTREQVFEALRRRGAEVLNAGFLQTAVCPPEVAPEAAALVVAVEVSAVPKARNLMRQITARQLPQLTIVLLLRQPATMDKFPHNVTLLAATRVFTQLKADGVFWEPKTAEGLEDVVEMWLVCAAERAKEREQELREEAHRHEALKSEAENFWSEVHTIFSNIPQLCLRIGEPEVGGRIGRHHDIVKLLGTGAYGDVYLLRHIASKELKALKAVAKDRLSAYNQVQAISKEIASLKRLSHPNVVAFLGAAHTPKHVCMLLEYGGSKTLLKAQKEAGEEGLLPPPSAQHFFKQVASAIAHCHSRGLAHRDVRQENVVIGQNGRAAKLVDFGAADDVSSPLELLGSVPFIAPEVMANESGEYSAAHADVWSLGVLFSEMLCGLGFLPSVLSWRLPAEPRPELAQELRQLLADWDGLAAAMGGRQTLSRGYLSILQHMLRPNGAQRWSASAIAGYNSYDET